MKCVALHSQQIVEPWTLGEAGDLVEKWMAFPFFFPMALSFISRPTSISLGRFILPRGQRGTHLTHSFTSRPTRIPFDTFFYLAANEDPIWHVLLPRGQRGTFLSGALFYLAANEDPFSRALYFTSRQRGSPFPGRFILPRGQRGSLLSRALSFTSRPTRISFDTLFYLAANEGSLVIGRDVT